MIDKKKLKEEYKKKTFQMGVFQIRNTRTNKIFIDHSVNMESLWNRHKTELNLGSHQNKDLLKDWQELGEESFAFEILSILEKSENVVNYKKRAETPAADDYRRDGSRYFLLNKTD